MLKRWRLRRQWRNSSAFEEAILRECAWLRELHGDEALAMARKKLARPHQRQSRKWVWQAVVERLEQDDAGRLTSADQA